MLLLLQVECAPTSPIVVDVDTYRTTQGGYLRLDLQDVAGSGALASVELRKALEGVSALCITPGA